MGGAHDVDDALDLLGSVLGPIRVIDDHVDQTGTPGRAGHQPRGAENTGQQRQPTERVGVMKLTAQRSVVDPGIHQSGRQPQCRR
jgi:hypothetical protein